jgi:hypothetical protein
MDILPSAYHFAPSHQVLLTSVRSALLVPPNTDMTRSRASLGKTRFQRAHC